LERRLQEAERALGLSRRRDEELRVTIAKLIVAEEASETAFTCMSCLKIFTDPVTCTPCGHSFCAQCMRRRGYCLQCGPKTAVRYHPNELLGALAAKCLFRKQALASLKRLSAEDALIATSVLLAAQPPPAAPAVP
jgi:hypothetical protein